MTDDSPDMDALARRVMDLWQDQWQAMMADPQMAESFGRMMSTMGQMTASFGPMAAAMMGQPPFAGGPFPGGPYPGGPQTGPAGVWPMAAASGSSDDPEQAPGTAPAGPASSGGPVDLAELAGRIEALERRFDAIEQRLDALGSGTAKPSAAKPSTRSTRARSAKPGTTKPG